MKRLFLVFVTLILCSCSNDWAAIQQQHEYNTAQYRSEYAVIRPKLNMNESSFKEYRKVVFYNVRLGTTVFACIGYTHIQIDEDGDIELVVKVGENNYLRHYLMPRQDITYFSEQLEPNEVSGYKYEIIWNPDLWVPNFKLARPIGK